MTASPSVVRVPALIVAVVSALLGMTLIIAVGNAIWLVDAAVTAGVAVPSVLASPVATTALALIALHAVAAVALLRAWRGAAVAATVLGALPFPSLLSELTPLSVLDSLLGAVVIVGVWMRPSREFAAERRAARIDERRRRSGRPTVPRRLRVPRAGALPPQRSPRLP